MKGKKLPKRIWVVADELGWYASEKPRAVKNTVAAFYTPAKSAKVCRWPSLEGGIATGCDAAILAHHSYKFCPYCGGKIRTKR